MNQHFFFAFPHHRAAASVLAAPELPVSGTAEQGLCLSTDLVTESTSSALRGCNWRGNPPAAARHCFHRDLLLKYISDFWCLTISSRILCFCLGPWSIKGNNVKLRIFSQQHYIQERGIKRLRTEITKCTTHTHTHTHTWTHSTELNS